MREYREENRIVKLLLALTITLFLAGLIQGCKSEDEPITTITDSESSPDYSQSGCRGRADGIKAGPTDLFLPYPSGNSYTVSQTWYGTFSHYFTGAEHALDFVMSEGTIIYPVAAGRVMALKEDSDTTCSSNCDDANYVIIDHGDQVYGRYLHMCYNCVDVSVGQEVSSDTQIGRAGNTGWSTESHLHFELRDWEENCTVTYGFNENGNSATALTQGSEYTSTNDGSDTYPTASVITGSTYKNVGVNLTSNIDWYLASGSSISIQGSLTDEAQAEGNNGVSVFLIDGEQSLVTSPETLVFQSGTSFDFNYTIPSVPAGNYYLGISKSSNGSYWWENPPTIVVY